MIRYPAPCMYSVTPKLGRIGFEDNPTTAMVLYFFRILRMASAFASAPPGSSVLIARPVHLCLRASKSPAPWPTNICHFLPPSPPKCGSLPEIPSTPASARSRPSAADHRSPPSLLDPLP